MIKITIPHVLVGANEYINAERSHRHRAARLKKSQTNLCAKYIRQAMKRGVAIGADQYPLSIEMHWYMPDKRKDLDNIAFSKKFIFDGMMQAELIPNDGYKQIQSLSDKYLVDKDAPRVEIIIKGAEK